MHDKIGFRDTADDSKGESRGGSAFINGSPIRLRLYQIFSQKTSETHLLAVPELLRNTR